MAYRNQREEFVEGIRCLIIKNLSFEERDAYNEEISKEGKGKKPIKADMILPMGCKKMSWHNYTFVEIKYDAGYGTIHSVYQKYESHKNNSHDFEVAIICRNFSNLLLPQKQKEHFYILSEDDLYATLQEQRENVRCKVTLLSNDEKYKDCKVAFNKGDCTLFLGAGVGISAGLPGWDSLLQKMKDNIDNKSNRRRDTMMVKKACDRSTLIIAQYMRELMKKLMKKETRYVNAVGRALYSQKTNMDNKLLNSIVDLIYYESESMRKVSSIITYNFDDLLEEAMARRGKIKPQIIDWVNIPRNKYRIPIYHVHGVIPHYYKEFPINVCRIVLAEEDYLSLYNRPYSWANMRQKSALENSTCIFIGMSMNDPNLRRLLAASVLSDKAHKVHYAFLRRTILSNEELTANNEETMDRIFSNLGVQVIWYDEHKELPDKLHGLMENK